MGCASSSEIEPATEKDRRKKLRALRSIGDDGNRQESNSSNMPSTESSGRTEKHCVSHNPLLSAPSVETTAAAGPSPAVGEGGPHRNNENENASANHNQSMVNHINQPHHVGSSPVKPESSEGQNEAIEGPSMPTLDLSLKSAASPRSSSPATEMNFSGLHSMESSRQHQKPQEVSL